MKNKVDIFTNASYYFATDIGRVRLSNEDNAIVVANSYNQFLLVVCDGMGGSNKGDYASLTTINLLEETFKKKRKFFNENTALIWLAKTIRSINSEIFNEASRDINYQGMATTLTAVLYINHHLVLAQIGDSRAYILKEGKLSQISEDQSYVGHLYRTGQIKKEEMATHPQRHVLLNALGYFPSVNIDLRKFQYSNEKILLCSDGLYNNVSESTIENVLNNKDSVQQKTNELIAIANQNGGSDNIAIVIWEPKE